MKTGGQRITSRAHSFNVLNFVAREEQKPETYINFLNELSKTDPEFKINYKTGISFKSLTPSTYLEEGGYPRILRIVLTKYETMDAKKFYSKSSKENVEIKWNDDHVVFDGDIELYFIPRLHLMIVPIIPQLSLMTFFNYFRRSIQNLENWNNKMHVHIAKETALVKKILDSEIIYSIEATISFSNPQHGDDFKELQKILDDSLREANPDSTTVVMKGSKETPLNKTSGGLVEALVNISSNHGSVKAVVKEHQGDKKTTILDTSEYPRKVSIKLLDSDWATSIYNFFMEHFKK